MPPLRKKSNNLGVIIAVVAAAVLISAALVFLGLQLKPMKASAIDDEYLTGKINEGIEAYVQKQMEDARKAQEAAANQPVAQEPGEVKAVTDSDHIRGTAKTKLTLIEYSDFECPFCGRFHETAKEIIEKYKGKVNWVYRHYPLGFHGEAAIKQAEAAECANELGGNKAFWQMADLLYTEGTDKTDLPALAVTIGLNKDKFKVCLDSGKYNELVKAAVEEGTKAGVQGTPGNIIYNNETGEAKLIAGAYPIQEFDKVIAEMLGE